MRLSTVWVSPAAEALSHVAMSFRIACSSDVTASSQQSMRPTGEANRL